MNFIFLSLPKFASRRDQAMLYYISCSSIDRMSTDKLHYNVYTVIVGA